MGEVLSQWSLSLSADTANKNANDSGTALTVWAHAYWKLDSGL